MTSSCLLNELLDVVLDRSRVVASRRWLRSRLNKGNSRRERDEEAVIGSELEGWKGRKELEQFGGDD